MSEDNKSNQSENKKENVVLDKTMQQVIDKINGAENILVALSNDPSVDEMAASIGLTLALDKAGKRATAIYSGATPNALQFLNPEKTLERNTNSLRDFIIALDKEKADRLQYKLEGDFIKVFITPYKANLSSNDLEFSHGDYNVDLVIGVDIASENSLDAALSEYGRIMHDASSINITNEAAGRFCEIEWASADASSVSEMVYDLLNHIAGLDDKVITQEVATALLTGIVASTERFSNEKTTPNTMKAASELMTLGADQKLIANEITKSGSTEIEEVADAEDKSDSAVIDIPNESAEGQTEGLSAEDELEKMLNLTSAPNEEKVESAMDMLAGEVDLNHDEMPEAAPVEVAPVEAAPVVETTPIENVPVSEAAPVEVPSMVEAAPVEAAPVEVPSMVEATPVVEAAPVEPVTDGKVTIEAPVNEEKPIDFSEMMEAELAAPAMAAPVMMAEPMPIESPEAAMQAAVDAALAAPTVPEYGMMPPAEIPVDAVPAEVPVEVPVMPQTAPGVEVVKVDDSAEKAVNVNPVVIQPDTMGPVDPSAFKIPGM